MAVQVLDVTLRDGGYLNGFSFSADDGCAIAGALNSAGVPFAEIGYFIPRRSDFDELGRKGYSLEHLEKVAARCHPSTKTVVMVPPGAVKPGDYFDLVRVGVDVVRFPASPPKLPLVAREIEAAREAGLKTSVNIVRTSEYKLEDLTAFAGRIAELSPDWLYLADSNGALFPDQVKCIFEHLRGHFDLPLGFHPHDGLSLAFANALQAIEGGASLVDASLGGMGKGGGNLALEMIALYLNSRNQAAFDCRPMFQAASRYLLGWLGESWPRHVKETLSSMINLNQQTLIEMGRESGGDIWKFVDCLMETFETKFRVLEPSYGD